MRSKADETFVIVETLICPLQTIAYYNERGGPVFSIFVDSSKAFDRVSHNILFDKLIERNVPLCIVCLLSFWYAHQQMVVKWGNCFSSFFTVSIV